MKSLNNAIAGQAVLAGSTSDHDLERMLLIRQYELSILGLFQADMSQGPLIPAWDKNIFR